MEPIQERALRFVYDDLTSSYDSLLDQANASTLTLSRMQASGMAWCAFATAGVNPLACRPVQASGMAWCSTIPRRTPYVCIVHDLYYFVCSVNKHFST